MTFKIKQMDRSDKPALMKVLTDIPEFTPSEVSVAEEVIAGLKESRLDGLVVMGNVGETVCEMPVGLNKVGIILFGGLNPVAAAVEAGIEGTNRAMSSVIDFQELGSFWEL